MPFGIEKTGDKPMSQIVAKDDLKLVQAKINEIHNILYSLAERMPPGNIKLKLDLQSFRNNHPDVVRQVASELIEEEMRKQELKEAFEPKGDRKKVFNEKWCNEVRRLITHLVRETGRQTFTYPELDNFSRPRPSGLESGKKLVGKDLFPRPYELAHYFDPPILIQIQSGPPAIYKVPDEAYKKILGGGSL